MILLKQSYQGKFKFYVNFLQTAILHRTFFFFYFKNKKIKLRLLPPFGILTDKFQSR